MLEAAEQARPQSNGVAPAGAFTVKSWFQSLNEMSRFRSTLFRPLAWPCSEGGLRPSRTCSRFSLVGRWVELSNHESDPWAVF